MGFVGKEVISFEDVKSTEIINHILKNHHRLLKDELPKAKELIYTIYRVHFQDDGDVLGKVHNLFGTLMTELESHIIKEERALFYMIKDYNKKESEELLKDILKGIEDIKISNKKVIELLEKIREATNNYILLPESCPTYEKTYNKLKKIEENTKDHIKLEENILFNRFK